MTTTEAAMCVTLTAQPDEVRRARNLVGGTLAAWRSLVDGDVVLLLVSELVTNALLHGRAPLELRATKLGDGVRVEVHDAANTAFPAPRRDSVRLVSGRGLALVDALASRWGWRPIHNGKLVWFELDH